MRMPAARLPLALVAGLLAPFAALATPLERATHESPFEPSPFPAISPVPEFQDDALRDGPLPGSGIGMDTGGGAGRSDRELFGLGLTAFGGLSVGGTALPAATSPGYRLPDIAAPGALAPPAYSIAGPAEQGAPGLVCRDYPRDLAVGGAAVNTTMRRACLRADGSWVVEP